MSELLYSGQMAILLEEEVESEDIMAGGARVLSPHLPKLCLLWWRSIESHCFDSPRGNSALLLVAEGC